MRTKTFTILLTITDDGCTPAISPVLLEAAIEGALESGIKQFAVDSTRATMLRKSSLTRNASPGTHSMAPVLSVVCTAISGDFLPDRGDEMAAAKRLHAALRAD